MPQKIKHLAILLEIISAAFLATSAEANPLDDYVWTPDDNYMYEVIDDWTLNMNGVTSYLLNLTSQRWLTDDDVTRSIWWHDLIVHVPDIRDPALNGSALLIVEKGDNTDGLPTTQTPYFEETSMIAATTGSVVAMVRQVPNQSLMFKGDPDELFRVEDSILAYGWRQFLDNTTAPEWLPLLPMTKAAIRAMDAVTDFVNITINAEITQYCVGGGSKRGWTSWLAAAVDGTRVKCVAPIVFDLLNYRKVLQNQYRSWGGWSTILFDYFSFNITRYWTTNYSPMKMSRKIIDPFEYKNRLSMPKFLVVASGDEIFPVDDSRTFLSQLKGPTYINVFPNMDHRFLNKEPEVFTSVGTFYNSIMKGYTLPNVSWVLGNNGSAGFIRVKTDSEPSNITAWYATTLQDERRDFRRIIFNISTGQILFQNVEWFSDNNVISLPVTNGKYRYYYEMDAPTNGTWIGFFIQMRFPTPDGVDFECTTETKIVPDTFPFEKCIGDGCLGPIV